MQFGSCCFKCNGATTYHLKGSSFSASLFVRGCNLKIHFTAVQLGEISSSSRPRFQTFFPLRTLTDTISSDRIVLPFPTVSLTCSRTFAKISDSDEINLYKYQRSYVKYSRAHLSHSSIDTTKLILLYK